MKNTFILILGFLAGIYGFTHAGDTYKTNSGNIHFFSHTDIEDIEANNHKVKSAFETQNGVIQFSVVVKDFEFEKALMQEHFNENYMESNQYPRAKFDGKIMDLGAIKFSKDGSYSSKVKGKLTIKDVTREIETTATFKVTGDNVNGKATFIINPEDYNIEIPKVVSDKISREIKITVDSDYKKV